MAIAKVDKGGARISVHQFHRISSIIVACSVQGKSLDRSGVSIGRIKIKLSNRNLGIAYSRVGGSSSSRCIKRKAVSRKCNTFGRWIICSISCSALHPITSCIRGCCARCGIIFGSTYCSSSTTGVSAERKGCCPYPVIGPRIATVLGYILNGGTRTCTAKAFVNLQGIWQTVTVRICCWQS